MNTLGSVNRAAQARPAKSGAGLQCDVTTIAQPCFLRIKQYNGDCCVFVQLDYLKYAPFEKLL
jgi:hypothetical protein